MDRERMYFARESTVGYTCCSKGGRSDAAARAAPGDYGRCDVAVGELCWRASSADCTNARRDSNTGAAANSAAAVYARANGRTANGRTTNGRTTNSRTGNGDPTNGCTTNGEPIDSYPTDRRPANGRPANGRPANC